MFCSYTKIVKVKTLYDDECTENVHQIQTYIQKIYRMYKICTKFRLKTTLNLKCMFFQHRNTVEKIQNLCS